MKKESEVTLTDSWKRYRLGVEYNERLNLYSKAELYWNFYNDIHWQGIKDNGLPKYMFNMCKTTINYFIAYMCSQPQKIIYSANNLPDEVVSEQDLGVKSFTQQMSALAQIKWEKDKMDYKLRQLLLDGAITGDFCAYVYWDDRVVTGQFEIGDFKTEIVDGLNIFFGNPNTTDVQSQPYIIMSGRDTVKNLREEAKELGGLSDEDLEMIVPDTNTSYQVAKDGRNELDTKEDNAKCNFIIEFKRNDDTGTIIWTKSVKSIEIRKDVDLGITLYPIAYGNWGTIKNSYHGNPVMSGIIDNKISINQLFAMCAYAMKHSAFGKVVYDGTKIVDGWNNSIGEAIRAEGDTSGIIQQIRAGDFNSAILEIIRLSIDYTKEFIGANDVLMGNVDPQRSSGVAVLAIQKQAAIPLGNILANRTQFLEDLALIWGEFFLRKYRERRVTYEKEGLLVSENFNTENMQGIFLQCKIDIGASTYWSEIITNQKLDELLQQGVLNKVQYFARMKELNIIPDCEGLLADAEKELAEQQQMAQQQQMMMQQAALQAPETQQAPPPDIQAQEFDDTQERNDTFEKLAQYLEQQPKEVQDAISTLPADEMEKQTLQLMKKDMSGKFKKGNPQV